MEEKILQELREIKEMLRIVASNTEQKEIKISLDSSDSNTDDLV